MEEFDWKDGSVEEGKHSIFPVFLSSILFFQSIYILRWQYRRVFHEIVRLDLPHLHICSKRPNAVSMLR